MNEFKHQHNYQNEWGKLIGHLYQLEVRISPEDEEKIREIVRKYDCTYCR